MRNIHFARVLFWGGGLCLGAFAGAQKAGQKEQILSINPNARNTQVLIRSAREENQSAEMEEYPDNPRIQLPAHLERWRRPAVGFMVAMQNATIIKSHFHITSDSVLIGKGKEFGFGLNGYIDFPIPSVESARAFRFALGFAQASISAESTTLENYAAAQLENRATSLVLAGYYRLAPRLDLSVGVLWLGGGLVIHHAFATAYPQQGSLGVSRVRSSYGFHGAVSAGLSMPLSDHNDAEIALDWYPWGGFNGQVGLRTSL